MKMGAFVGDTSWEDNKPIMLMFLGAQYACANISGKAEKNLRIEFRYKFAQSLGSNHLNSRQRQKRVLHPTPSRLTEEAKTITARADEMLHHLVSIIVRIGKSSDWHP